MSETLKPCPFCGDLLVHVIGWDHALSHPRLFHEYHHVDNDCPLGWRRKYLEDSTEMRAAFIENWNTRAADAEVERLRAALLAAVKEPPK